MLLAPVIGNTTHAPVAPAASNPVVISSTVTDASASLSGVNLTYELGPSANAFTETFGSTATTSGNNWNGTADKTWTLGTNGSSAFKLATAANYVSSSPNCGLQYNCSKSTTITSSAINLSGALSATVQFYVDMVSTTSKDSVTLELGSGSSFTADTCTNLGVNSNGFTEYNCIVTNGSQLVNGEELQFAFTGGGGSDGGLIYLDQITVLTQSTGGTLAMSGSDDAYTATIPKQASGATVYYYVTATDSQGYSTTNPTGAPATTSSYTVRATDTPPTITNTSLSPTIVTPTSTVVTSDISDQSALTAENLLYNGGSGWVTVPMSTTGNGVYSASIPEFAAGTAVQYYISASDDVSLTTTDPAAAPTTNYSYTVYSAPTITNTTLSPATVTAASTVQITSNVSSQSALSVVDLVYNAGSGAVTVPMSTAGSGVYTANIPAFLVGTTVKYYVSATDSVGLTSTDPGANSAGYLYSYFDMGKFDVTAEQYCDYLNSALSQGLIQVENGLVYGAGSV